MTHPFRSAPPPRLYMDERRGSDSPWLMLMAVGLLVSAVLCWGCGTPLQGAVRTQGALSQSLAAATGEWLAFDLDQQKAVVEAAPSGGARAALQHYRDTQQAPVAKALNATWAALVLLDGAIAAMQAGDKKDIAGAIAAVLRAFEQLQVLLGQMGVHLPSLTGVPEPMLPDPPLLPVKDTSRPVYITRHRVEYR